ncbi:hypothetical protein GLOIN_2v1826960, partial [Rhizophagus irregularis DAOM 181602=DAOM 197198]
MMFISNFRKNLTLDYQWLYIIVPWTVKKKKKLKSWKENTIQLMIATNAFDMGLNGKKVRLVIHYSIHYSFPLSI